MLGAATFVFSTVSSGMSILRHVLQYTTNAAHIRSKLLRLTRRAMATYKIPMVLEFSPAEVARMEGLGLVSPGKMVRTKPGNVLLPERYRSLADKHSSFQFRANDMVLVSYPKSGTVWTSEILWAMTHLNHLHLSDQARITDRVYLFEKDISVPHYPGDGTLNMVKFSKDLPEALPEDGVVLQLAEAHRDDPRIIHSHFPLNLLNPNLLDTCKVVYVARNPKDVCLSSYHHYSLRGMFKGEFTNYAELFMRGEVAYGPYWSHLRQAWQRRHHHNLHIMLYEDMRSDLLAQLRILSNFLKLDLNENQLMKVVEHTRFDTMKARESKVPVIDYLNKGSFFRKGHVGDWSNRASKELDDRMNAWIKDESQDIDITFKYE